MPEGIKGGLPVYWREYGSGTEPALLLHCALAHSKAWAGVAECLSNDLHMIAPDMPGHGRSTSYAADDTLNDTIFGVALECLPEPAHVIGHSYGATIALRLALEYPERVRSLTLIEPVLFAAARHHAPDVFEAYLQSAAPFAEAMACGAWEHAAKGFTSTWGDGKDWRLLSETAKAQLASQMPFIQATQLPLLEDTAGLLREGGLEAITCPTILIRGSDTEPVIAAIHDALQQRIPGAVDHVVTGAAHMVPITHPKHVAGRIQALLSKL